LESFCFSGVLSTVPYQPLNQRVVLLLVPLVSRRAQKHFLRSASSVFPLADAQLKEVTSRLDQLQTTLQDQQAKTTSQLDQLQTTTSQLQDQQAMLQVTVKESLDSRNDKTGLVP